MLSLLAGSLTSCISIKGTPMVLDNRDNEDATRHDEGHGKDDDERGGWAVVPILQQWFRFFLDSNYLTNSTTEGPTVAPDATKTMKTPSPRYIALSTRFSACQTRRNARGTWLPPPTQPTENERSRSFSAVGGFPWSLPPRQPISRPPQLPKSSPDARFRRLWTVFACLHYDQPSTNRRNQASAPVPGACRLSLPVECTPNIHHAAKSRTA